ncbi:hypothetical protein ABEV34_25190 [Methylorubrum rhodesianum]|uniref:c-type cytochrome n=1 Tax=Methylorubrum rhodesianum TaxID=29427 RepID=UPI00161970B9|nr:hypothetical protein [Methylorubrum rhodesianum]MBB5761824.1 cytochrome c [Methylorubrum rhodesianum]MDV2986608.1 hypothetical protein [Methylobacteriaceae bacterium AG10]
MGLAVLALPVPSPPSPAARSHPAARAAVDVPAATFDPVFRPCAHRHRIGACARHLSGPALIQAFGRAAGEAEGDPFSQAKRQSGLVWDAATLARFPKDRQGVVPRPVHAVCGLFAGIGDDGQLGRIVGLLRQADGADTRLAAGPAR